MGKDKGRVKTKRGLLCAAIVVLLFCVNLISVHAKQEESKGRVLFISSYSYGRTNTQAQIEGMSAKMGKNIVLDYEFMDTKRVDDAVSRQQFYESISYRLSKSEPYDVIILGDDAAFLFAMEYREVLFDGIPLVYQGVNDKDITAEFLEEPTITGIAEELSVKENIAFGLTLYPSARKVIAILDNSITGQAERKSFYNCAELYPELEFEEINASSLTTNELRREIRKLGEDTLLLYIVMTEDASGRRYSDEEASQIIVNHARIPTLCMLEDRVGNGFLGGNVVSMYRSGEIAAGIATDIIYGYQNNEIGTIIDSPNVYCIDELAMKRFELPLTLIPEGAVVINHQPSFWERNKEVLIPGSMLVVVLLIAIFWVVVDNYRRRKLMEELEEARNIMESASQHDFLTGLSNRSKFMRDLKDYVAAGTPCTIMMLDIDYFKSINDTYGHSAGDEALKQLADRLKEMQTPILTPYRFAGDEFIILLKSAQKKIVDKEVFKCSQLFRDPFILAGEKKQIGGSIGIAAYPADALEVEQLINCADDAMYQVKKSGRNHYAFYHGQIGS
ncbi:putative signaling protein [Lachnospiraceae bacterium]|nr:putative signaling protein [Lachnospiraceae bacterium]